MTDQKIIQKAEEQASEAKRYFKILTDDYWKRFFPSILIEWRKLPESKKAKTDFLSWTEKKVREYKPPPIP